MVDIFEIGDLVYAKLEGFPWWPGKVSNVEIIEKDNKIE